MSAPTLDRNPRTTSTQAGTSAGRRRRKQLVLVASALVVLAIAVGTSLAIATRPAAPQATADPVAVPAAAAADQNANADQNSTAQPAQGSQSGTATKPDRATKSDSGSDSGSDSKAGSSGSGATASAALEDGTHDVYITRIDRASNRIVVDVVQVFEGDRAVKEAIADGRPRSDAQYLTTWVRNENPRLRTLPMASGVVVKLWNSCEESSKDRDAVFNALAENASQKGTYYYALTVSHGKVTQIQERLAINAC